MPKTLTAPENQRLMKMPFSDNYDRIDNTVTKYVSSFNYNGDTETQVLHKKRIEVFIALMEDLRAKGIINVESSALDVGCLEGLFSKIISDLGFEKVVGVDIMADCIESANRNYSISTNEKKIIFKVADAQHLDTSEKFDFVLCTEVIEHVDNPQLAIDGIYNVLKPGGIAVVSMPNLVSVPMLGILLGSKIRGHIDPVLEQHLKYPFFRTLTLFKDTGFEVLMTTGSNLIINSQLLSVIYGRSMFPTIDKVDSILSSKRPLNYFSQSFFMVLKKAK